MPLKQSKEYLIKAKISELSYGLIKDKLQKISTGLSSVSCNAMLLSQETVVNAEVKRESSIGKQELCFTPTVDTIEIDNRSFQYPKQKREAHSHSHFKNLTKAESHLISWVILPDALYVRLSITELKFFLTKTKG